MYEVLEYSIKYFLRKKIIYETFGQNVQRLMQKKIKAPLYLVVGIEAFYFF